MPLSFIIKSSPFSLHASEGGAVFHKLVIVVIERLNVPRGLHLTENEVVYCKVVSNNTFCSEEHPSFFRLLKYEGKI